MMQKFGPHRPSFPARPSARLPHRPLIGALLALCLPLAAWAAPSPSPALARNSATPPPFHIVSVDSVRLASPTAYGLGTPAAPFPGDPTPDDLATRRFTVRWYANPQATLSAVLLLEFATPSSPGVVRSRTLRLDPNAAGFQTTHFDVPYPDAIYWQASILASGRLLSRLQSPNWYEIRHR